MTPKRDDSMPDDIHEVLQRYPAAKAGLEGWVARLDAEPNAN